MATAVHIPGGPRIQVRDQDPKKARYQASAEDMAMARELVSSPAWEWFVGKCDGKAKYFEQMLLDVNGKVDHRQEDRLRGMADSYRRMPAVVQEVAAQHERLRKQQEKEQQQ